MNTESTAVKNYMRLSSIFVYENDSLFSALEAMKKFQLESISIIKEDFSIVGYIEKKKIQELLEAKFQNNVSQLKSERIIDAVRKYDFPIVVYPGMTLIDAYSLMKCFNIRCLPVVDVPWEKKIIGFLWLDDILPVIRKTYIKIPV